MEKNKGSALLSALFIMTLVAIAATAMTLRMHLDIYRTQLTINADKRYLAAQAVVFWAMDSLANKKNTFMKRYPDDQVANFPKSLQNIYPGFTLNGKLYDLQAKINVNSVTQKQYFPVLQSLFNHVLNNKNPEERKAILLALEAWITEYDIETGEDAYSSYYLQQNPPYYTSHQPMKSLSELRLVQGVDASTYLALSPFLAVIPERLPININTAPKKVLLSLKENLSESQIEDIIQARKERGIINQTELNPLISKLGINATIVTIESQYFLVIAEVKNADITLVNYSLLKREQKKEGNNMVYLIEEGCI